MSPPGRVGFIAGNFKFRGPGEVPKYPLTEIFPSVMVAPHWRKGLMLQRDHRRGAAGGGLGYWRTTSTEHVA
jgi:hypothetical protein